jgi:hypothetical protein
MQLRRRLDRRPRRARPGAHGARPATLASLAIVFSLLFGQLVQLAHLLVVPHQACEHGELTHTALPVAEPKRAEPARPRTDVRDVRRGGPTRAVEPSEQAKGEHDHCEPRTLCRRDVEVGPFVGEASLLNLLDLRALPPALERRPIALLSVAPKSSPPRA